MDPLSIYVLAALLAADLGIITAMIVLFQTVVVMQKFGLWLSNGRANELLNADTEIQGLRLWSGALSAIAVIFGIVCLGGVADMFICASVREANVILLPVVSIILTVALVVAATVVGYCSISTVQDTYRDFAQSWIMIGTLRRSYAAGEPELTEAMIQAQRKSRRNKKSELFVINNKTKRCEVPKRRILR